jgi:hypothetical protein
MALMACELRVVIVANVQLSALSVLYYRDAHGRGPGAAEIHMCCAIICLLEVSFGCLAGSCSTHGADR